MWNDLDNIYADRRGASFVLVFIVLLPLQHDDTLAHDFGYIWQQDAALATGCTAAIAFPFATGGATVSLTNILP